MNHSHLLAWQTDEVCVGRLLMMRIVTTVDYLIMHIFMQDAQGVQFKGGHPFLGFYN